MSSFVFNKTADNLIIVESPSKIRKIESSLGTNFNVIATNGHLCEISNLKNLYFVKMEN